MDIITLMDLGRMAGTVKHERQWHTCGLEVMENSRTHGCFMVDFPMGRGFYGNCVALLSLGSQYLWECS